MVSPRKKETSPASGTESTPARCVCRKKLEARNGTRPCWIRSNVSSNVFTMNQKRLPTSRRKLRESWPAPWATKTGGLASAMAGEPSLSSLEHQGTAVSHLSFVVRWLGSHRSLETLRHHQSPPVTF